MSLKDTLAIAASVIVSLGGGGAIVLAFSGFLGRLWADRALERQRQENARLNLALTHQLGLLAEQTKYALQMSALEHQIRFSKLHERRADAIENLYSRLVEAHKNARHFALGEGYSTDKQKQDDAYLKIEREMTGFWDFIETHRIYLPEQFCVALETFLGAMRKPLIAVSLDGSVGDNPTPRDLEERRATFREACRTFDEVIPALRKSLEYEFRKILGVENPTSLDGTR